MPATRSMSRRFGAHCALGLFALAWVAAWPAPALAQGGFPHIGYYGNVKGNGYPLWDSTGVLNATTLTQLSRYHELILDVAPLTPYRPDALTALRVRNPNILLMAYVTGDYIWPNADPDSLVHYPTRYWRTVRDLDGFLYNKSGALFGMTNHAFADVNLAKRDLSGHYVVAEAMAQLFHDAIYASGQWDGIFFDTYCSGILWAQAPAESIDFARAGYADAASFDVAWRAGTDTLASRLRGLVGPTYRLVGNCIPGTKYGWFNGWMRENFPYQGGGTWYDNMLRDPGGYLTDDTRYLTPRMNHINTASEPSSAPYSTWNLRKLRLGLASAALGDGYHVFGPGERDSYVAPYHSWWYDEYAVDLSTGRSSDLLQDTGWLGVALAPWYQMIWVGTNPDAVSNPDFETDVTSGWNFWQQGGVATIDQDGSTAGKGSASAHVHVNAVTDFDWRVTLSSISTLNLNAGLNYSATFWARSSSPRTMKVACSAPGGGGIAWGTVNVGTQWQQYQLAMIPNATAASSLQFYFGNAAGDVWIDDAHLQLGATTIYRRDFLNGTVLVNPSLLPLTLPLEHMFRKILGTVDPVTNDGSSVTQVTVPAQDALFLIGEDFIAPAAVRDAHVSR